MESSESTKCRKTNTFQGCLEPTTVDVSESLGPRGWHLQNKKKVYIWQIWVKLSFHLSLFTKRFFVIWKTKTKCWHHQSSDETLVSQRSRYVSVTSWWGPSKSALVIAAIPAMKAFFGLAYILSASGSGELTTTTRSGNLNKHTASVYISLHIELPSCLVYHLDQFSARSDHKPDQQMWIKCMLFPFSHQRIHPKSTYVQRPSVNLFWFRKS